MKETKLNQTQPSEELFEKVRLIAYAKSMVSLRYRGGFNKFGVYVQSKDIFEKDSDKTIQILPLLVGASCALSRNSIWLVLSPSLTSH